MEKQLFENIPPDKRIEMLEANAEMECVLESVEANDLIKQLSNERIDAELNEIALIAPDIVQIEV
jgi:ribosome assembly protein YihI (activator of Der GTPase)